MSGNSGFMNGGPNGNSYFNRTANPSYNQGYSNQQMYPGNQQYSNYGQNQNYNNQSGFQQQQFPIPPQANRSFMQQNSNFSPNPNNYQQQQSNLLPPQRQPSGFQQQPPNYQQQQSQNRLNYTQPQQYSNFSQQQQPSNYQQQQHPNQSSYTQPQQYSNFSQQQQPPQQLPNYQLPPPQQISSFPQPSPPPQPFQTNPTKFPTSSMLPTKGLFTIKTAPKTQQVTTPQSSSKQDPKSSTSPPPSQQNSSTQSLRSQSRSPPPSSSTSQTSSFQQGPGSATNSPLPQQKQQFQPPPQGFNQTSQFTQPPPQGFNQTPQFQPPPQQGFNQTPQFQPPPQPSQQGFNQFPQFQPPPQQGFSQTSQFQPPPQPPQQAFNQPPQSQLSAPPSNTGFNQTSQFPQQPPQPAFNQSPQPQSQLSAPPSSTGFGSAQQFQSQPSQQVIASNPWDQRKLMDIMSQSLEDLSRYSWCPEMWKNCYKSLENNPQARAKLIGLASKYTVQFIRDRKPIPQAQSSGGDIVVNPNPVYVPSSSVAFLPSQDLSRRGGEHVQEMKFQKTVTATMRGTDLFLVNADALDIAEQLVRKSPSKKVLVVNACDHASHGGRWLSGECGQEENFMIRSELCSVQGEYGYPLNDKMLIVARDVGVVRGPMAAGYPFLNTDTWHVDMASIPNPTSSQSASLGAQVFNLQVRLEMVFRAALEEGHKILVLPLFMGMKTPGDTAAVIDGVFRAFGGCFEQIYIAGSNKYYPTEVIFEFAKVLARDVDSTQWKNGSQNIQDYSPHTYVASTPPMPYNCYNIDSTPCSHWEKCQDMSSKHRNTYAHPPPCPVGSFCNSKDPTHLAMYMHIVKCKNGSTCPIAVAVVSNTVDDGDTDAANHMKVFSHPKACDQWATCSETDPSHLAEFLHPPMCPNGPSCQELKNQRHAVTFRHLMKACPAGTRCPRYADPKHRAEAMHPFKTPCPKGVDCDMKDSDKYAHLCPDGPKCSKIDDPKHIKDWIHVGMECKHGNKCTDLSEEHLGSYYHSSWRGKPTRRLCRNKWCSDYSPKHRREYAHYPFWLAPSPVLMLNVIDPIPDSRGRRDTFCFPIMENGKHWIDKIDSYARGSMPDENSTNFVQIRNWFETMQPNHMCSAKTFLSICNLGNYTSLALLKDFWVKKNDLIEAVMQGPYTRHLITRHGINNTDDETLSWVRKYGRKYIRVRQGEISRDKIASFQNKPNALSALNATKPVAASKNISCVEARTILCTSTSEDFVKDFEAHINKILNDVLTLIADPPGIGNTKNVEVRTNYTVFTIVGPHFGNYDGAEVVMVLKQEIMNHPDFYMCPMSVLNYQDGDFKTNRPWVSSTKVGSRGYYEELDREKVAGFTPDWATAAAKEWIARVHINTKKPFNSVTLTDVLENWISLGPWSTIEGHLPYRVPLEYTDHVIFCKKAYNEVKADNTGSIILREWEKTYGKDFIKIVSTPDEVKQETALYHTTKMGQEIRSPKGMCFCLDKSSYEKVLPMYLNTGGNSHYWITFTAKGPFYLSLSTDCTVTNSSRKILTILVQSPEASAYYLAPSVCISSKMEASCSEFNTMLPQEGFIQYALEVNYQTGTVAIFHWGPSSAVNSEKFEIPIERGVKYRYISFASREDVLFFPIIWELRHSNKPPLCVLEPVNSGVKCNTQQQQQQHQQQSKGSQSPPPASPQPPKKSGFKFGFKPNRQALPDCTEPFDCVKANSRKDADHSSHIRQFSHVCKFGSGCRSLSDSKHTMSFHHMDKSPCPNGAGCTSLTDPGHRFEFYHKGLPDFLLPCKYGQGCKDINNEQHCMEYYHNANFAFPPLSSVKLLN